MHSAPAQFRLRFDPNRSARLLVACGCFVGLLLAAALTWHIVTLRHDVIEDAAREIRNDALMLAEEENRLLQAVDAVQLDLITAIRQAGIETPDAFEKLMGTRAAHQNLGDRIAGLAYISTLSLRDRRGGLVNISRAWPPPTMNDADRDFIRDLAEPGVPAPFISAPSVSRISGKWVAYLSRRVEAANGDLLGFVMCTLRIDYFEQFYASLPLTGEGAFSLVRSDGVVIARYPNMDNRIGGTLAHTTNFSRLISMLDGAIPPNKGVVRQISTFDGLDRLTAPRAMAHFPLIITVSDTLRSILANWRRQAMAMITLTAMLELTIAWTTFMALRQVRDHQRLLEADAARARAEAALVLAAERDRATETLRQRELRFDAALRNMISGLFMVDHDGMILVVNRRFFELLGLPPDIVAPGMSYDDLRQFVRSRGNVLPVDAAVLGRRRRALIEGGIRASFDWELSDGRAFTVTHQPTAEGWLATMEDITERRAAEARIGHLANHDTLTDLPNRVLLRAELEHALAFVRRGHSLALHCLDLDQFKTVNDTLGHPIGDRLLQAVARRLLDGSRETDMVARLGGDEFAIVQNAIGSPLDATEWAGRLIEKMRAPFDVDGHQVVIGTSIGIALAPQDGLDADQLLKCADLALYRAKADGRGAYRLFQADMDATMRARRQLELDLREAMSSDELEMFFQPKVDVRSKRVSGCEALLRWRHPRNGLVPPDHFIALAEETGLIVPIGAWILRQSCAAAAGWPDDVKVAVNLSPVQFSCPDLVDHVIDALRESGLPPGRLELEITETAMLRDTDATLAALHQFRDLGIHIAMDDFGTGYSSLSYLRCFPFDRIKIDQSFVRDLGHREDCIAIVRAVTALGRDLGMAVTAEGVETRSQLDALELAGCAEIQGFLFSRPLPASEVIGFMRSTVGIEAIWPPSGARQAA